MNEKPNYYAILTANVRYDKDLLPNEKLLYCEITALCDKHGYCWATNKYFAELYSVSNRTIINWINNLEKKGYIKKQIIYKSDSNEIEKRILTIGGANFTGPSEADFMRPGEADFTGPREADFTENNTSINNTSINNIRVSKDTLCQTQDVRQQVIDAWNTLSEYEIPKINKLSSNAKRSKNLNARLKEYSLDDVLKAIDNIKNSDYLQGKVNGWNITFDWFVLPSNFIKVLEGNYNNKSSLQVATDENFQLTVNAYPVEVTNIRDSKKAWENAIRQLGDNKDSLKKIYSAICLYKTHCKEQNKYAKNFDKWIETELDYWLKKVG